MKDVEFEDWRLTVFWIAVAVATAIAGFVFGWCWRDRSGALANVSLLAALTAVGTVGATGVALYFGLSSQRKDLDDRKQKLSSVLILVESAVEEARWVANHLDTRFANRGKERVGLARNELSAFLTAVDTINRIPFHEPHYSEAHAALVWILGMLRSLAPLISNYRDAPDEADEKMVRRKVRSLYELLDRELKSVRENEPFKGFPSIAPM